MISAPPGPLAAGPMTEDWWAVGIGLSLIAVGAMVFHAGYGLQSLIIVPQTWSSLRELHTQVTYDLPRYAGLAITLLCLFTPAAAAMGFRPLRFASGFLLLLLLSLLTLAIAAWAPIREHGLEPPIIALLSGVVVGNALALPSWVKEALRAELYIKTGVVLLGATIPLPLLRLAGPVAIFQASFVSLITFATIYGVARFLGVDRRLGAMLAAGGSVCGVSAVIAVAGAVRARREDVSIATAMVVIWALGMIVLLPVLARAWYLSAGVAGAWIGSSEYADAAGIAAVQVYNGFLRGGALAGSPDQAIWAFTLVKVIGRDMWIGLLAAAISLYAVLRWEPGNDQALDIAQIWHRFPKFTIGFVLASVLVTWTDETLNLADFNSIVRPGLIEPLDALRNLTFTLSFLSIGASIRLRSLMPAGGNAFIAFATGVVVNLAVGFILSAQVFAAYWVNIKR
jgi:uncharacterized membrane protein YadS